MALPVARLRVCEPGSLFGQRAERLDEDAPALDGERDLAGSGAEQGSLRLDEVAEVQQLQERVLLLG